MTPETQPHDYDADEQYITQLASECGPVIYGMYQYYNRRSMMHQPEIALFAALEAIGVICGRIWEADEIQYQTARGDIKPIPATTTTDYLTILAKTGAGKETAKQMICEFLESVDIPTPAGATTAGSIHKEAQKHPRTVIITDEAGLNRQTTGTGKGDPYGKKTVETYLMDIYAGRSKVTKPPQIDENPKAGQYMANERKRYDGLTSLWEIQIIAAADAPARDEIFDEYKNAKAEADTLERNRKEGEPPTPEEQAARDREAKARNQYKAKIHAAETACHRIYTDNPTVITAKHVEIARKLIDFAGESSEKHLIDAIPAETWHDCKEAIRTLLRNAPDHRMAKSRIEERTGRFKILGDKFTQLLKDMEGDSEIKIMQSFGGATIYLIDPQYMSQPEPEGSVVPVTSGE